jgi:hypothetical protein
LQGCTAGSSDLDKIIFVFLSLSMSQSLSSGVSCNKHFRIS